MFDNLRDILNFDDVLFEKRNRDYGAYQLRKRYNSVIIFCIFFASLLVTAAIVIPFAVKPRSEKVLSGGSGFVQVQMENLEPPMENIVVPPPPPPPEISKMQDVVKYVPPVVVDTILPVDPEPATTDELLSQNQYDELEISGTGTGTDEESLTGSDGIGTDEPFFIVEIMPSFKGGDINKFREWVQKRTNYPEEAIEKRIKGVVFLTFVIETDGSVSNVTVVKGVDPLIDNEAVKAIQSSPKWSPGLQRGKPVRVRYSMPLSFVY